jgi:hypothetical protein
MGDSSPHHTVNVRVGTMDPWTRSNSGLWDTLDRGAVSRMSLDIC